MAPDTPSTGLTDGVLRAFNSRIDAQPVPDDPTYWLGETFIITEDVAAAWGERPTAKPKGEPAWKQEQRKAWKKRR